MAVIRARSLDCPGFLILSLLLLVGAGRVLCEGNPESGGAPTVSQCRTHIEAALKDFVTHHKLEDEQSSVRDIPTEEALQAGEQSQLDTSPTEDEEITDKGDTVSDDTARATEQDDDKTQAEGDDDDDGGTEGTADDGDEEGTQTEAEGATADESKKDDEQTEGADDEQTEGDDEDSEQTGDDEDSDQTEGDDQTADEGDDQTDGDDVTAKHAAAEDTADDEETVAEGEEGTEGDEGTGGDEGDEGTEGDDEQTPTAEDDEPTAAGDHEETDGGDDDDDEQTKTEVEGQEEQTETGGEDDDEQEEQTETGGGEGDEVEGDEAGDQSQQDETEGVEGGDTEKEKEEEESEEVKAEESEVEDEKGDTEGDETGQEDATEDVTKEGEEAGDAGTAEDVSEAAQTQGAETDEPSRGDGQQSGEEDAEDEGDGTEEDVSEHAASEGDECGGDGQSAADEPEEEEETATEEETEAVKPRRGELRSRAHIEEILGLDDASISSAVSTEKLIQNILKDLKRMYESAIKPMELLYKFKDISNRYVGDSEIFSKPMILFIGPWSSGKSTIINYLLDIEDTKHALPTGAEPKSSDFTVLTHGDTEVMLGGTELAADWTFSTMQKFGQAFLDQLKGMQLPNNLLRKITIVDTPGILENRKIQERTYPFNDVCQWFIDRADIIYVVFDPTKLDMGLEMEALFDQLKGREAQVRIVLNKADTVSPQELMRVQSTLLWNLSPLLGSSEAPTIFVGNFWSRHYIKGSPSTLFEAQEEALLHDLRHVIVGRVENKISFTRRHAVRVRNHAKMVDCYLNTYYNHKTFFGNKKKVADDIIENPQSYHIYEGLSTLTNVSRYDLPDPDIYRDFFRVNPLYEFKQLASTCSFFKGCPLDKLDLTISFELPELMGKYRKLVGAAPHGASGDRR